MKQKLLALTLALCMALPLAACSGGKPAPTKAPAPTGAAPTEAVTAAADDWSYIQKKGELVIGYTVFEPMNFTNAEGKFVGFETEFAQAVCEKLGVKAKFQEINWDTKILELDAKNIDCIWNGMTITDDLKANIAVSDPYIKNMQVVVIKNADAATYPDAASLASKTITAELGSAGEAAIATDPSLSKATYVGLAKQTDALMEVKAGTSDAAVLDYVLADATIGAGTDFADLQLIPGLELSLEEYGVGFRKGSSAAAQVNTAIAALVADGTLNRIAETYGLAGQLIANQK